MEGRYNTRSPAVKRLMREAQELSEPTDQYFAQPLEDNLFEWHFTVRGPADSDFQNGIYHGRIILPVDYPMKPPSIIWLTPNGRFETNKKICLSISGHHPESWQPSWSIRTALLAIIGFMPTRPGGAIGSLDYTPEERKVLAKRSREWQCPSCGDVKTILLEPSEESDTTSQEAKDLAAQINFQGEKAKGKEESPIEGVASESPPAAPPTAQPTSEETTNEGAPTATPSPASAVPLPLPFMPWMNPSAGFLGPQMGAAPHPQGIAAMMPRFPYPPSHYPAGFMPTLMPSSYMFPPPPPYPTNMGHLSNPANVEVNNSSTPNTDAPATATNTPIPPPPPPRPPRTYTRTPMSVSVVSHPKVEVVSAQVEAAAAPPEELAARNVPSIQFKGSVMEELLQKVKRVDSDSSVDGPVTGAEGSIKLDKENEKDNEAKNTAPEPDSEVSQSLKKDSQGGATGSELLHLELGGDDSSEHDAPPISDSEHRSVMEKNVSSGSTSELERRSRGQTGNKSLRQRQSDTGRLLTENEDGQTSAENSQRIQASSGDSQTGRARDRLNIAINRFAARQNYREVLHEMRERNSPYDFTFIAMVALSCFTILILFNRLRHIIQLGELGEALPDGDEL